MTLTPVVADFRAMLPAFANPVVYPDNVILLQFDTATNYISDKNYGILNGNARLSALYNMTAHLMQLNNMIADNNGAAPGMVTDAKVGAVAVTLKPPPVANQYQWWLSLTPYGQALLAQLKAKAVGGFWIGSGVSELAGFRRGGGRFLPR